MVSKVYKYLLELASFQKIDTAYKVVKILRAELQNGHICLWAEVDTESEDVDAIQVSMNYTGANLAHDGIEGFEYVSTVFLQELVYHVYAKVDK